ncbi:MAG TPA: WecB/TagA/CpsF family glycosyltransferase [Polyangiaceae bacterium LLY-WYZ-15_(1-7)]|nr:hypothetical protein [Sandaracinus sp.]HJK89951.1 WecB/TagA/CpsF family glycosyltransferase [Polyangiaceae bacterium LLY-WYZ-15_(1-7)]MBJ70383.1 hypothetical protein [Sandaracinus sp.]HJL03825.1 WecB/TagA/CpsF family glycosyltransferase [Polyangiaceae bacterium LLY-WYZ-15_(1-7)]HJL07561.1 WecB/TagA/CpsF family glycosyltransferase [Polyangiaceae bacterium LLY-WYZ-15_(1-7)]
MSELLPRARLVDVLLGRAPLVGSRLDPSAPRGLVSPVEARVRMGIPYGDLRADEAAQLAAGAGAKVALKALVAALLEGGGEETPSVPLVSTELDALTIEEALEALLAPAPPDRARLAYLVHPHALNLALLDGAHRRRLAEADLRLPDGIGLRIGARLLGRKLRHNLCGTDLVPPLLERARARDVDVVLVGGAPGVAERCAAVWEEAHDAPIAWTSHGYLDADGVEALRARLRAGGGGLVLVGMGSPVQERFAAEQLADLGGWTVLTVGGLFDYFAGNVPRAPLVWRELGLEWLFRLLQEPRRLALRYLVGNPAFLLATVAQRAGALRVPPARRHLPAPPPRLEAGGHERAA